MGQTHQIIHYTSIAAVYLFMRRPEDLDEGEQMDLAALCRVHLDLNTTYDLTQNVLQMVRQPSFTASKITQLVSWFLCCFPGHPSGTGKRTHRPPVPIRPRAFHK